jgi:hypothetical protein
MMKGRKRLVSIAALVVMPFLLTGCFTAYRREVVAKENLPGVKRETVLLYRGAAKFYLTDVSVVNDRLEATASVPTVGIYPNRNEVLYIYASPEVEIPASLPAHISVPLAAIYDAEVYDVNGDKTAQYRSAGTTGILIGIAIPLALVGLLIFGQ